MAIDTESINGVNGVHEANRVDGSDKINGMNGTNGSDGGAGGVGHINQFSGTDSKAQPTSQAQDPVAVVSMACRLPDECNTPRAFWKFLEQGKVAMNTPPGTRFSLNTHYDASLKAQTMASPGGMFLQNVDPRDMDAQFFKLSGIEATSMDPQQRQLLEVVYEGLENAGVSLEEIDSTPVGCFVSSFACDYGDMQARDPENRASATVVGVGRAMLSNRISHFLNIKGPSMTIDTACSGALIGLDLAMRYLRTREISSAIVAGANLYCSPEHVMDHYMGANGAASLSGKCHTFDEKADGYIKAEAVNMVYLKRLDDAIRDKDCIRAVIRGTATNSDGWTAGIASPNPKAQSAAIRQAYKNAGITDLSQTSYVEFHGTGTRAGDSLEAEGVSSVFTRHQSSEKPLRIGSVKSNIGHSEPAAGLSSLLKTVLSLENGIIPGNPTFINPSPKINFGKLRFWASRSATPWSKVSFRRASINCFGYGGSNAHVIVDGAQGVDQCFVSSYSTEEDDGLWKEENIKRPYLLAFSANSEKSLEGQLSSFDKHLSDPAVNVQLRDLAYTLGDRKSRFYHRAFTVSSGTELDLQSFIRGHVRGDPEPRIGLIFTGQGAQWPEMGKDLLETFPRAAHTVKYLDQVLQSSHTSPSWTLYDELVSSRSAEHMRLPAISQPLVTAIQLAILALFDEAGLTYNAVAGHSSGEIAAAVAAGYLSPEQAIKVAYYRGKATSEATYEAPVGMMAVGLGPDAIHPYLEGTTISIACFNSPQSITLSGNKFQLMELEKRLKKDGHFARLLLVDAAYHSRYMARVADNYQDLLEKHVEWPTNPQRANKRAVMFSSTTGKVVVDFPRPEYWVKNMVSPVLFSNAVHDMIAAEIDGVDHLVEIGPSNALSGPVNQIKKAAGSEIEYSPAWKRGNEAVQTLLECAGKLFTIGCPIRLAPFNQDEKLNPPMFISDLPNYSWDHSTKYWHEAESSSDWRYRKFVHHDLLGSKILGTPWSSPIWKNILRLGDVTWLRDHTLGDNVVFPAAGYIAMAMEAIYQKSKVTGKVAEETVVNQITYKLRNISFPRMLTLDGNAGTKMLLSLEPCSSTKETWHQFTISSIAKDGSGALEEHCRGLVSIGEHVRQPATERDAGPLQHAVPGSLWYKSMREVGYFFGPAFQPCEQIEAKADSRHCRALIKLEPPLSRLPQSQYAMHPSTVDGCLQIATVALNRGHRSAIDTLMPPRLIDDLVIFPQPERVTRGIVATEAIWSGVGRPDDNKRFASDIRTFSEESEEMLFHLQGLRYHAINASTDKPHAFTQVVWELDPDFITPDQMSGVLKNVKATGDENGLALARVARVASIVAHKRPSAKLLEVTLEDGPAASQSLWIDHLKRIAGPIAEGCAYTFSIPSQKAGLQARETYSTEGNIEFVVREADAPFRGEIKYDFIILKVSLATKRLADVLESLRGVLTENSYVTVLQSFEFPSQNGDTNIPLINDDISPPGFEAIPGIGAQGSLSLTYIGAQKMKREFHSSDSKVHLVRFGAQNGSTDRLCDILAGHAWEMIEHTMSVDTIPEKSTVLVVDEMFSAVLTDINDNQFEALRHLIERECRILWVSMGSQMKVTHPERGLMFGFARSLLREYPKNQILCLDVESNTSTTSLEAIHTALVHLSSTENLGQDDNEFVERDGIFNISRVTADDPINKAEKESQEGVELQDGILHNHKSTIRLVSERPGTLDALNYAQVQELPPLKDDEVEIEVHAAGMNFKDLANAMGFVPANEHLFGLECAGIVTGIGKEVVTVSPGDRVMMVRRDGGCFANRVRNRWHAVYHLEDRFSFEEGTTFGIAIHTAVYGLITLANVQRGQSVLIHSASGGVGLAALDLCKYLGAEVYVTVGTDQKRDFLAENYGVPRNRMFTSRSTTFAVELMKATGGRGVDVCLNSLTGDMLHESWRCIAENGNLIEIGKKDMLDRNSLSMEPFDRNCSYRALDLSRPSITDEVTRKVGELIMDLSSKGHIRPLHICKVFPFEETVEAFRYMQRGKHIGKVVISYGKSNTVKVPFRPLTPTLRLREDCSYLIAGGFKGLNSWLAVYLARNGARNLATISRGGYQDERSQKTIYDCNTLGCTVELFTGDITRIEDVRSVFKNVSKPIIGVIQGAVVIRDRMFTSMTPQEFRDSISPKVVGTWNLHHAAQEQSLPLDFFTMLSSVSGLVGQMGQSNYSSANTFQDAFAAWRVQQSLPACSIVLGPVEEVGILKDRDSTSRRLESQGWSLINEALMYRIIRAGILQQTHKINPDSNGMLVTAILPGNPPFKALHRFSSLRPAAGTAAITGGSGGATCAATKLAMLKNASKGNVDHATLLAATSELVNAALMRGLGISEPLEASRPLADYGVDSLVAVEMRNWTRAELGVELSVLEIVGSRTLMTMCETLLKRLLA